MNNVFQTNECDLSFLTTVFDGWRHSCLDVRIGTDSSDLITVFCCQSETLNELEASWAEINGTIAADYITNIVKDFERWNTYLLFTCIESIPSALQFEIENNKFAMRKVLVSDTRKILVDIELSKILNKKILASNVEIDHALELITDIPIFSSVSSRLLAKKFNVNNVKEFSRNRSVWLDTELERMANSEN
jgi:hypothetical protein